MKEFIEGYTYSREHDFEFQSCDHHIYVWEIDPHDKTPSFIFITKDMIVNGEFNPISKASIAWNKQVHITHNEESRIIHLNTREREGILLKLMKRGKHLNF